MSSVALTAPSQLPTLPADHRHRGSEILLHILGAFLVVALIDNWEAFVKFLARGCNLEEDSKWVVGAYFAFVLNVFRQIHGLAIATTDLNYRQNRHNSFANFCEYIGLLAVILVPAGFLTHMRHVASHTTSKADPHMILYSYLWVVVAYFLWDFIQFVKLVGTGAGGLRNFRAWSGSRWFKVLASLGVCTALSLIAGCQLQTTLHNNYASWGFGIVIGTITGIVLGNLTNLLAEEDQRLRSILAPYKNLQVSMGEPVGLDLIKLGSRLFAAGVKYFLLLAWRLTCRLWKADDTRFYVLNWQLLLLVTLCSSVLLITVFPTFPAIPFFIMLICAGYSFLDYIFNWRFYFSY